MKPSDIPIAELVPHAGNMVLVDQLTSAGDNGAEAIVCVSNEGRFCGPQNQVPAWTGIEYMAQTIAAWAGYQARLHNEPVKLGFLLGTRRYSSNVSHYHCGDVLTIKIERNIGDANGLGSFSCSISGTDSATGKQIWQESSLNVFQPNEEQIRELLEAKNE